MGNKKRLKVALTYNLKPEEKKGHFFDEDEFAEWDTIETINAVRDALSIDNDVILIEANIDCYNNLIYHKPDIVFNIAEGKKGFSREAFVPALCEFLGIPFTGSDSLTLSSTLHKARTKQILSFFNIPSPNYQLIKNESEIESYIFNFPAIVKPVAEGSSKGIYNKCLVYNSKDLKEIVISTLNSYNQPCIIEEFLPGREFTVALIGNGNNLIVLPIVEINFSALPIDLAPIYSYEAKWIADTKDNPLDIFTCPAHLEKELEDKIIDIAKATFNALECKDWARIDIRLDKDSIPNIIEINPLPGILPDPASNSCFPKAARAAGLDYNSMINKVLLEGLKRYNLK